jgi:hypothetical protein
LSIFKNVFPVDRSAINPETLAWLKSNIIRRFPQGEPSGVDIVWRKASYDVAHPGDVRFTTVRTVHLDFGREP